MLPEVMKGRSAANETTAAGARPGAPPQPQPPPDSAASHKGNGKTALGRSNRKTGRVTISVPDEEVTGSGGSSSIGAAPTGVPSPGAAAPDSADGGMHPGLDRIKNLNRKKTLFRGASHAASTYEELAAAMDAVDQRIGGALRHLRAHNSAGLGPVRGLMHSQSGRLRVASKGGTGSSVAAQTGATSMAAASAGGEGNERLQGAPGAEDGAGPTGAAVQQGHPPATLVALPQSGQKESLDAADTAPAGPDWTRDLPQFSDFRLQQLALLQPPQQLQPQALPAPTGSTTSQDPAPTHDTISWLESGAGLKPQTAVSAANAGAGYSVAKSTAASSVRPKTAVGSREEVALLQAWLQDQMAQIVAQAGQQQVQAAGGGADLADAVLWVYGMAFEELQRQIGTECADRGMLLGGMWQHVFKLVELRCSLVYESVIGAIRMELEGARQQAAASEQRAQEALVLARDCSRERYHAMEAEVKHMTQLLATAEEEASLQVEELALLRRAVDTQSAQRSAAEDRLAQEQRQRLDLQHARDELMARVAEQAAAVAARDAELVQLRGNLEHARTQALGLGEDKARLEVEGRKVMRDFQTAEIMGMSLREQLATREAELAALNQRHSQLAQEQATVTGQLADVRAAHNSLQIKHESLQASSAERVQQLQAGLQAQHAELDQTQRQLSAAQEDCQALERSLQATAAREAALAGQLKQLAEAHEQQGAKLRLETDARRTGNDELQAIRAGLQVTQQRLETLGLVFASNAVHRTAAEAWRATGPISMCRQVVAAVNQQLAELAARKAELLHEAAAAKERWQAEEAVRIRVQEQLLEARAQLSKLSKEREGLEGVSSRLEAQRASLDAELAQMRKMLGDAEARCQASHKKAMEAANEAKRLAPLEPKVARLEEAIRTAATELERVQHEVTAHQSSIRKLLDEKSTALEQLAARSQALDAAQLQIRELTAASRDRMQLADDKAKLEEELHGLRQRCCATERLQSESMHQLTVARRLLTDAHSADERAQLQTAQRELHDCKLAAGVQWREVLLLRDRLAAAEGQLAFMEKQLQVAVHTPLAAAVAAATSGPGAGGQGGVAPALVEQLRRLLDTKEERIRQLERLQSSLTASTSQLRQLQGELSARTAEVAQLQAEVDTTRRRLHTLQELQAKAATKDLVALAATDPGLPPNIAQALALDYARSHLRSELTWTRGKLAFVCHMAGGLRAKLQQADAQRAQAEMESVCVEAFYLQQALLEQRAFAAAFDATFVQVKRMLMAALETVVELRRKLVAPAQADLPCIAGQVGSLVLSLNDWLKRFSSRKDQSCVADPLAELEAWQRAMLSGLPVGRPTSPPPLQHVSAIIVQVYVHRLRQLPLQGPSERSPLVDNVHEAMAEFFCERRGFSRGAALSPTGPVAALLAGARSHLQQPKPLLLGRLAGLAPSGGTGSSRSLQHPAAWQFFVRLLCCLRALLGAGWEALVKEWTECEEGVPLPLQCVMDVLANLYNTDSPALLDSMRQGLVPLVRQGRRGPAVDLDAFLLVVMHEYCNGSCPISPLALPRRLTDGLAASASLVGGSGGGSGNAACLGGATMPAVAVAAGAAEAYVAAGGDGKHHLQQRSPMRKRIINLTVGPDVQLLGGSMHPPPPAAGTPEPAAGRHDYGDQGSGSRGSPGAASSLPPAAAAAAAAGGATPAGGGSRSPHVLASMHHLMSANPALPLGLRSQLRASAPNSLLPGDHI